MISKEQTNYFAQIETPFYFYDMELLRNTLSFYCRLLERYGYRAHYALKANADERIISEISRCGLGADCVSGNEVSLAVRSGFDPSGIVFAGVGKSDSEILTALDNGIFCFNVESVPEMKVIDELSASRGVVANVAIRVNPDIDAHTHKYISTGMAENKFGISPWEFDSVIDTLDSCKNLNFTGLHFHIGSQITTPGVFALLCHRVAELEKYFIDKGLQVQNINLGGGLGVDYEHPDEHPIADFESYFSTISANLEVRPGQTVHFEPGRSLVAQCGHLVSRVLYVKEGRDKKFVILDAGMNDLIRPALYQAWHDVRNLSFDQTMELCDVVGPVCESSDCWGEQRLVGTPHRGDLFAINTAGAYGQVMAMRYNQKDFAKAYYSDKL